VTVVWRAAPAEAPTVTRLLVGFRDWMGSSDPDEQSFATSIQRLFDDPSTEFLLAATDTGSPACGVCQLRFRHSIWTAAPDCWLEDLYVEAAARGAGVGRALVQFSFERALARGARRIELDTNEDNAGAIALYESLGFSAASKRHGEMRGRDLFMGRPLS
jgi:ribosomal protein S18 acetylase RimI-like enzyme